MAQNNIRTGVTANPIPFPQPSSTTSASPTTTTTTTASATTTSPSVSATQAIPISPSVSISTSTSRPNDARLRLVPYTPPMGAMISGPSQTPSLRFAPVERSIPPNVIVKVGRYTDRHTREGPRHLEGEVEPIRFKSKVVSRLHAEVWYERGELYIRDTASSSGTFLNQARLSPQNVRSSAVRVRDGDCLQLGVEYRGGEQEIFRCVRMRVELNRRHADNATYRNAALAAVISPLQGASLGRSVSGSPAGDATLMAGGTGLASTSANTMALGPSASGGGTDLTAGTGNGPADCCICLLPLRRSTLLVTPCAHCYHFTCIRPLLRMRTRAGVTEEADGFTCPICRAYVDLMAEPEELSEGELAEMAAMAAQAAAASAAAAAAGEAEVEGVASATADPAVATSSSSTGPTEDVNPLSANTSSDPDSSNQRHGPSLEGNQGASRSNSAGNTPSNFGVSAPMTMSGEEGDGREEEPEWEADPHRAPPRSALVSEEILSVTEQARGLRISEDETGAGSSRDNFIPTPAQEGEEDGDTTHHPDGVREGEDRGRGGEMESAMTPPSTGGLFPSTFLNAPAPPTSASSSSDSSTSSAYAPTSALADPPSIVGSSQGPAADQGNDNERGGDEDEDAEDEEGRSRRLEKSAHKDEV